MSTVRSAGLFVLAVIGAGAAGVTAAPQARDMNVLVRPYSTQQVVELNADETCTFKLRSGAERSI